MSRAFDICGPLPTGITVLEASAGTGKTYTIAALAARYVADGTPLDRLLLVTFTRMATGELRDRVRERLVSAERALANPSAVRDDVERLLADGPPDVVALRRARLLRALGDFDAATIATTHGFCQEVLGGLGVAGDLEPDAELVEDVGDLLAEVVDDLYVRRYMNDEDAPRITRAEAMRIARETVENPGAPIEPRDTSGPDLPALRARLAARVRAELDRRKRAQSLITYDDLLTRLREALRESPDAVARLRQRYRVVLVDEFQDTDPIQWEILQRAFGDGATTLVLIGDPKQAIYAFRGADVYSYLAAAETAGRRATLEVNWRSDQGLIDAYDAMFGGAKLGHEGIVYRRVRSAVEGEPRRVGAPLRVRVADRSQLELTQQGFAKVNSAREHIARDLAEDLVAVLGAGIKPGEVAVLVRTNKQALLVRDALDELDIPAVINGAGSVFATPAAREWLRLLEALERPASPARARAATMTSFLGWSAERVASASEEEWEEVHRRLHAWAAVLRRRGLASLTETITIVERLPGRVLRLLDGERQLTDLRHIGQLLHAAAAAEKLGTSALAVWLRQRVAEAEQEGEEERLRRLESDEEAVQVLTIHRSKGLEFPVVYVPYLWEPSWIDEKPIPIVFHDPANDFARTIDVGLDGPDYRRHKDQHVSEQRGEDLRLAYVALTRAKHQAVVWWAGSWSSRDSALSRLLFDRDEDGNVADSGRRPPSDETAIARFRELASAAPGCVSVERTGSSTLPIAYSGPLQRPTELAAASFTRELDRRWRRTSYSDITSASHEARVASEPEERVIDDEPPPPAVEPSGSALPLGAVPGGTQFGTFVHAVLETTDFAASDLEAELRARVAAELARRPVDGAAIGPVVAGLRAALETPLGPLVGGRRLRDVTRSDRLDELGFELPLAGGDDPIGRITPGALGAVLREHLEPGDPLAPYADRLEDPDLRASVRGYLTGSIDLVLRAGERFAVVDYKTNWLGDPGEELRPDHYRPAALAAEMERSHYHLQALLYTAALHRYLRWRLPSYDPERHLAGVLYLFVRGMTGAPESGVFAWRAPAGLVVALSDLLDRGVPE
ncbi:MAG TPA: UvrD-helicase domain-containing protein [Solirubrobacter sp.]|nr:UvrD-helicase domain-containing protein [Solirubrobacter sp.]